MVRIKPKPAAKPPYFTATLGKGLDALEALAEVEDASLTELARRLTAETGILPGARIVVFGGPGEEALAKPALDGLPDESRLNLVGKLDLPTIAAALRRSSLYIGNDSGLMHLAAAAGCPTLGLFGPSPEWRYAPWGPHCAVVRTPESYRELTGAPGFDFADKTRCHMETLRVEPVVEAANDLLARTASATGR